MRLSQKEVAPQVPRWSQMLKPEGLLRGLKMLEDPYPALCLVLAPVLSNKLSSDH